MVLGEMKTPPNKEVDAEGKFNDAAQQ